MRTMGNFDHMDESTAIMVYGEEYDLPDGTDFGVEPTESDLMAIEDDFDGWMDTDIYWTTRF